MALYTVSTPQILAAALVTAAISAGSSIMYIQQKEKALLPEVEIGLDGNCVQVTNYRNGDAYNCDDVKVLLRQYRLKTKEAEMPTDVADPQ